MEEIPMDDAFGLAAMVAILSAYFVFIIVMYLAVGFFLGKVFEKAGKPLWAGFVPIYNYMIMLEIVGRPAWWLVLMFIPFANIVTAIIVYIDFAKSFGKTAGWGVLLIFFSPIILAIMAFSDDIKYVGPSVTPPPAQ